MKLCSLVCCRITNEVVPKPQGTTRLTFLSKNFLWRVVDRKKMTFWFLPNTDKPFWSNLIENYVTDIFDEENHSNFFKIRKIHIYCELLREISALRVNYPTILSRVQSRSYLEKCVCKSPESSDENFVRILTFLIKLLCWDHIRHLWSKYSINWESFLTSSDHSITLSQKIIS